MQPEEAWFTPDNHPEFVLIIHQNKLKAGWN